MEGHTRSTRSTTHLGDWRDVYTALDRGRADGSIAVLTTSGTPQSPKVPTRFSAIQSMSDITERNKWYKAHFTENDGLFDKPNVLRAIPLPPGVTEADLMRLHTIYTIKSDGRYKARTVLGCGKDVVDQLNLGYDRSFSPTARASTFRTCCVLAAECDMIIRGGDATQAYGQADWPSQRENSGGGAPRRPPARLTSRAGRGGHGCCAGSVRPLGVEGGLR